MGESKGTRYTQEERDELLALYRQSGYGVSRFCTEMEISYGTLQLWLNRETNDKVSLVEVAAPAVEKRVSPRARLPNGIECELGAELGRGEALSWIRELMAC